jgi:hypothetical protein
MASDLAGQSMSPYLIGMALAVSLAMSGGTYVSGRIEGWDRRDQAQQAADFAALRENQMQFIEDLRANQQEGGQGARLEAEIGQTLGGIQNELSRLSSASVCYHDPARGVLVDQAVDTVNASIRTALGEPDGSAPGDPEPAAADRKDR